MTNVNPDVLQNTSIEFKCLGSVPAEIREHTLSIFPGVHFAESYCFSQTPPVTIIIISDAVAIAKAIGAPAILTWFLTNGEKVYKSLQGWKGCFQLFFPGKENRLSQLKSLVESLDTDTKVYFRLRMPLKVTNKEYLLGLDMDVDPDDQAVLLCALSKSIVTAIKSICRKKIKPAREISIKASVSTFSLHWQTEKRDSHYVSVFDFEGKQIGSTIDETEIVLAQFKKEIENLVKEIQ